THSGFDAMWSNLQRDAMQKYRDQTPISDCHKNPFAPIKIESHVSREIAVDDGVGCAGIHVNIHPTPSIVEKQSDGRRWGQPAKHRFVTEGDASSIHAP